MCILRYLPVRPSVRTPPRCCGTGRARFARTARAPPAPRRAAWPSGRAFGGRGRGSARRGRTRPPIRAGRSRRRCAVPATAPAWRRTPRHRRRARSPPGWHRRRHGFVPAPGRRERGLLHRTIVRCPGAARAFAQARPAGSCMVMQCRLPFCQISGRQPYRAPDARDPGRPAPANARRWRRGHRHRRHQHRRR